MPLRKYKYKIFVEMLDVKFILAIISLTLFGHDNIVISMKINTPRIMLNPISSEVINLTQA